ncbi:MAG: type II and III secretion system protein family protein [Methylophilaceae bacterium]|jgi:pilus assembly protein CpaC|nr:type II and III secretion system protein family protein [Methylophilales bacterium]
MKNKPIKINQRLNQCSYLIAATIGLTLLTGVPLLAAEPSSVDTKQSLPLKKSSPNKPKSDKFAQSHSTDAGSNLQTVAHTELTKKMVVSLGQSNVIRLPEGARLKKVKVDDDKIVQVEVTSPTEVVIYAKTLGSTVVIIWSKSGQATVIDVSVVGVTLGVDAESLQTKIQQALPSETAIKVSTAGDSLVLSGTVADIIKLDKAISLAEAYSPAGKKVINLLQVDAPQQVMLEVKMAEVSKNLLDKLGAQFNASRINGGVAYAIAAGFLSLTGANPASPGGLISISKGNTNIKIDAEDKDGIVKILAEPNIIAISGQEGSFLAGGKIFIPVPQAGATGVSTIVLEEKEFGVGLKFTPTVLEDGLINLRVAPEVSELSQSGTEITAGGGRSVLPSFVTRRVSTTVQLHDGQSFAIAGLIKNNVTETIRRFPILGNIPILGALFRSSEFQKDKTELIFVVTPRLVKPLPANFSLPTDSFNTPSKTDFFLNGKLEGSAQPTTSSHGQSISNPETKPTETIPAKSSNDGFEMK